MRKINNLDVLTSNGFDCQLLLYMF